MSQFQVIAGYTNWLSTSRMHLNEGSLLVLLLSMSNDVNQVFVVQVSSHIRGEGSKHLLHLSNRKGDNTTFIRCYPHTAHNPVCIKRVLRWFTQGFLFFCMKMCLTWTQVVVMMTFILVFFFFSIQLTHTHKTVIMMIISMGWGTAMYLFSWESVGLCR